MKIEKLPSGTYRVRKTVDKKPETSKSTRSAETYYDRFENDHINMIAHGDWTLGTYIVKVFLSLIET